MRNVEVKSLSCDQHWVQAIEWLRKTRRNQPHNADIWQMQFCHDALQDAIWRSLKRGEWQLSPVQVIRKRDGSSAAVWRAADALVLKWVALKIASVLPGHASCHHLRGGAHHSVRIVAKALSGGEYRHIFRTDIRGYYRHIRRDEAWQMLTFFVSDPTCLSVLRQYLWYSVEEGGEFHSPVDGISRGTALSPLIGSALLWWMDQYFSTRSGLFYVRYMDDFLMMSARRWPLKRGCRDLSRFFSQSGFERHPDKTQTGTLHRGFDWCGVQLSEDAPRISGRSLENYEVKRQALISNCQRTGTDPTTPLQQYAMHWQRWASGILKAARWPE